MTEVGELAPPGPAAQAKHHPRFESNSVARYAQPKRFREFVPVELLQTLRTLTGDGRSLIVFRASKEGS